MELSPNSIIETEVIEAFKDVVGLSQQEVAQSLLKRFTLQHAARQRMKEFNVTTPWQAFIKVRMNIYESMLADPQILHNHVCPYNVGLLRWAKSNGYRTGLATMSHFPQTRRVLQILNLQQEIDFIATLDDIENDKPDPEIYLLVSRKLNISPNKCLVIEDSIPGIKAALAAGMWCIAVTTDFTLKSVHESRLLDDRWIIDDPVNLEAVAKQLIAEKEFEQ